METSDSYSCYSDDFVRCNDNRCGNHWTMNGPESRYSSDESYPSEIGLRHDTPLHCNTYYCEKCGSDSDGIRMKHKCGNKLQYLWHMKQEHPDTFKSIKIEERDYITIVCSEPYYLDYMKSSIVPLEDDARGLKRLQDARLAQNLPPTNIVLPPLKRQKYECPECGFVNFHKGGFARHKCEKWKALNAKENLKRQKTDCILINQSKQVGVVK